MKPSGKNLDYLIVQALRDDSGYFSGEELASKLGISRQALWKHISNLTDRGYDITAVPHRGYKLVSSPDKFYPEEVKYKLGTKFLATQVYYYDAVDSTQKIAWQLGLEGAPEGTIVFTETQSKGRGRLERKWISPAGGIYFSLLLRPKSLLLSEITQISLIISLACLKGIKETTGIDCQVKWPNDILVSGKKLGGVLCEINAEADRVLFLIAGVGININSKDLPSGATSLHLYAKKKFRRLDITQEIIRQIEAAYLKVQQGESGELLAEWSKSCILWGKHLELKLSGKIIEGTAVNIDDKGYLILRVDNGTQHKVSAGDIVKVRSCR